VRDDELEVLSALADPTRWRLLDEIAVRGGTTATVLATGLPVSRQAVVKHLGILERAGLVTGRRAGREMRYSVRVERLDATARWMAEAAQRWDVRLDAIKALAEAPEAETGEAETEAEADKAETDEAEDPEAGRADTEYY
jgi:DNA-binding transcriptional ArsR family regulator